jgi:transcriptional regulator with XRE-family HTH domain
MKSFGEYIRKAREEKGLPLRRIAAALDIDTSILSKIEGIFKHKNIHFFDALVGYFRASGYFRIRKFIEKASEIRILVGINIDNLIKELPFKVGG